MKYQGLLKAALTLTLTLGSMSALAEIKAHYVPGEIIVKLKEGGEQEFFSQKGLDLAILREIHLSYGNLWVAKSFNKEGIEETINRLNQDPAVVYAEPNYIYYPIIDEMDQVKRLVNLSEVGPQMMSTDDPQLGKLWGLKGGDIPGVDAFRAWEMTKGSDDVVIAVVDTGVDYNHPDLARNIYVNEAEFNGVKGVDDDNNGLIDDIHGYDFKNKDGDPMDDHDHGSHCSGTIGAVHNNGEGVAGVMDRVKIMPVKFLSSSGGTTEDAIKSIDYATMMNVDLMSNSWGGGGFSQALKEAIERSAEKGILFVAAAGNSSGNNDSTPHYPSSYEVENVIAVAAHQESGPLASFSCFGKASVDIAAPGKDILSTIRGGKYGTFSGTSMATPHVSGVLGLLISQEGRMAFDVVKERLFATSVPVDAFKKKIASGGYINAYNLLTDTRPYRQPEPKEQDWVSIPLDEVFESTHPYAENSQLERNFKVEGAKYLRIVVKQYDIEARYDSLKFYNGTTEFDVLDGAGENFKSDYVATDNITVKFTSDRSVSKWGFVIEEVQAIYNDL